MNLQERHLDAIDNSLFENDGICNNEVLAVKAEEITIEEMGKFAEWLPQNAVIEKDGYGYLWLKNLNPITIDKLIQLFINKQPNT